MEIFKPVYEITDDISRVLGEIKSQDDIITNSRHHAYFLKKHWPEWKLESVKAAFKMQKWALGPDEIETYLNDDLLEGYRAAGIQKRIKNYADVLDQLQKSKPVSSLTFKDLGEIHRCLRDGVGGGDMYPGQLRTKFDAIYNPNKSVKFHLPNPGELEDHMRALFSWINTAEQQNVNPIVRAAIVHHRLMELRPFNQDNGKTTRLFFRKLLKSYEFPWRSFLPYETVFSKDVSRYYYLLDDYDHPHKNFKQRTDPNLSNWIAFHLDGVCRLLNHFRVRLAAEPPPKPKIKDLNARQKKALQYLKKHDSITNLLYRKLYHVGRNIAYLDLNDLLQKGFVYRVNSKGRSVIYRLSSD